MNGPIQDDLKNMQRLRDEAVGEAGKAKKEMEVMAKAAMGEIDTLEADLVKVEVCQDTNEGNEGGVGRVLLACLIHSSHPRPRSLPLSALVCPCRPWWASRPFPVFGIRHILMVLCPLHPKEDNDRLTAQVGDLRRLLETHGISYPVADEIRNL